MSVASMIRKWGKAVGIQRKATDSLDATGGRIESWTTTMTTPVFLQVQSGSDAVVAGREARLRTAVAYLAGKYDDIAIEDRFTYSGATWEITSKRTPDERSGDAMTYTIVDLSEVI